MTIALTAAPDLTSSIPRMVLNIATTTGTPNPVAANAPITLYRIDPDGAQRRVIIEAGRILSAGNATCYDYHAPFNQGVRYRVVFGASSANATIATGYYDYAPLPNILPSPLASAGNTGDPLGNGWAPGLGTSVVSGVGAQLGSIVVTTAATNAPVIDLMAPSAVLDVTGSTGTHTLVVDLTNLTSAVTTVTPTLTWFDASGAVLQNDAGSWSLASMSQALYTLATVRPAGGVAVGLDFSISTASTPPQVAIAGISLAVGTAATIPAAVLVATPAAGSILPSDVSWLIADSNPVMSVQVDGITEIGDRARAAAATLHWPFAARYPVALNEGVRQARTGQLTVRVATPIQQAKVDALLDDGGPILMNLANNAGWWDEGWAWIQPLGVTYSNPAMTAGSANYPYRHIVIPYQVIDTPSGSALSVWTWNDVAATFATWDLFAAAYPTWDAAAVNQQ